MSEPTHVKADLIPYTDEYAGIVRSWIDSEETYLFVCRGQSFPPPDDIVTAWQREGVASYVLFADRKPAAYGELWSRPREMAVEIAHVIVDPYKRSRGYGAKLIGLLHDRAAARADVATVIINVYNDNSVALGCFAKAGFELVSTTRFTAGLRMIRTVR